MIGTRGGLIIALFTVLSMGTTGNAQNGNWKAAAALPAAMEKSQRILANVHQRAGNSLTIQYRVPEVVIDEIRQGESGEARTRINLGNAPLAGIAGEPVLPVIPVQFIIPPGRTIKDVTVVPQLVTKAVLPHPVEYGATAVPLMRNAKVKKIPPNPDIYTSDNPFPGKNNEIVTVQRKRGVAIGIVNVHPITYYPKNNAIEYFRECEVTITFVPERGMRKEIRRMRSTRFDMKKLGVENPEVIEQYQDQNESVGGTNTPMDKQMLLNPEESFQYVVITSEEMRDAKTDLTVNDLIANRQELGLTATIVTVKSILEDYQGVDDQEKVSNFIIYAYNNW